MSSVASGRSEWISSRERGMRARLPGGLLAVLGWDVALCFKVGIGVGLAVLFCTLFGIIGLASYKVRSGRARVSSALARGQAPYATAALPQFVLLRKFPGLNLASNARSARMPLYMGTLTVHSDRVEWRLDSKPLARKLGPQLGTLVWQLEDSTQITFERSASPWPAEYLTIESSAGHDEMIVFDAKRIKDLLCNALAAVRRRPSVTAYPSAPVTGDFFVTQDERRRR